jgi:uncharacterized protein (TIGR03435 family)
MMTISFLLRATAVLGAGLLASWFARRSRAAVRHLLLASSFAMLLALPAVTALFPPLDVAVPTALETAIIPAVVDEAGSQVDTTPLAGVAATTPTIPVAATQWPTPFGIAVVLWAIGAAAFLIQLGHGLQTIRALRRSALPWRHAQLIGDELARAAGLRQPIPILLHGTLAGPMTCGVFQRVIIFPRDASSWSREDLRRAFVHELEHVRRRDWLTQCFVHIVASLYWFHPIVWIARRRFMLEAERACDDAVLCRQQPDRISTEETAYADQLVHLAGRLSARQVEVPLAMANRRDLAARVSAVLDLKQRRGPAGPTLVVTVGCIAAVLVSLVSSIRLVAQSQAGSTPSVAQQKKFDVASIRPCEPETTPPGARSGGGNGSFSTGHAFLTCFVVKNLIHTAYVNNRDNKAPGDPIDNWPRMLGAGPNDGGPQPVRGGPAWVYTDKYTIEAKAEGLDPSQPVRGSVSSDRALMLGPMLRALLEDRFKLKVHIETEQVPMWALTVAKGGLKVKPLPPEGGCTKLDPAKDRIPSMDEEMAMVRRGEKPICGHGIIGGQNAGNNALVLSNQTMAGVARSLSLFTDRMIVDKTGITDSFNLYLEFAADDFASDKSFFPQRNPGEPTLPPTAASLPVVLREKLGLVLEPTKGPRGYIQIDHIERPSPDGPSSQPTTPRRARGAGK